MPDFGQFDITDYGAPSAGSNFDPASLTPQMQSAAAMSVTQGGYNWAQTLGGAAVLAVPDLVDTVSSSLGLTQRQDVNKGLGDVLNPMLQTIGLPGLNRFAQENQGAVEAVSGIVGIIGAELATGGTITAAAPFVAAMRGASYAKKALSLEAEYSASLATVRSVDMELGRRGALGAAQYVGAVEAMGFGVGAAGEVVPTGVSLFSRASVASRARGVASLKGALRAGATEATMAVTLNQNSFLYSEDASMNIMFAALGVGIGAAVGRVGANYEMRKFVNSDQMQRVYAEALDTTGLEAQLTSVDSVMSAMNKKGPSTYLGSLQGHVTDKATSLMVQARAAPGAGVDTSTASRLGTQLEQLAYEETQKATMKGIRGLEATNFSMDASGYGNHMREIMRSDSGALLQAEMIGAAGDGRSLSLLHDQHGENIVNRKQMIQDRMSDAAGWAKLTDSQRIGFQKELKNLRWMESHVPIAYIDGEATTLEHAAAYDNWFEPEIRTKKEEGLSLWESTDLQTKKAHKVGIDSDMELYLPKGKDLTTADHFDMLRLYRSAQQGLRDIIKDPMGVLKLPEKPNWFQLDMAEELLRRTDQPGKVQWSGTLTREKAQVESFAQKVDALAASSRSDDPTAIAKLRVRYNLPKLTAYEMGVLATDEHPLDIIVRGAIGAGGGDAVRGNSLQQMLDGITESKKLTDLTVDAGKQANSLTGNTFNFMADFEGKPMKPILTYKRPFAPNAFIKDNLAERIAMNKANVLGQLTGNQADALTRELVANTIQSPDYQLASKVLGLADSQMSASTFGFENAAPGNALRGITDAISTTEWKFRDNPIVQAMTRLRETAERGAQAFMRQAFESTITPTVQILKGPRNGESNLLVQQFFSHAPGWELVDTPIQVEGREGKALHHFVLEDTAANRARFSAQYGREMEDGQNLLTPQGKEVVLDDLGLTVLNQFNQLTDMRRVQQNVLRKALGLSEMRRANFYVPPPSVEGKIVGHTYDALNRIVPGGTVIANTQEDFARQLANLKDASKYPDSPLLREGNLFRSADEVKAFATVMDRAQQEMVNPGRTHIAGLFSNKGKIAGQELRMGAFEEAMTAVRDGFLQHGRDLNEIMFKDAINSAKARSAISGGQTAESVSDNLKQKSKNIFDHYVQEATGSSPLRNDKSWIGKGYGLIESKANQLLAQASPKAARVFAQANDYLRNAIPYNLSKTEQDAFNEMTTSLGEFMPFKSVADQLEAKGAGKLPPTLAKITGDINKFEATWVLRMLEPVQAAMNLAGMVNALPAVTRHLTRKGGETLEEYAARIGHNSNIFGDEAQSFGVLDMGKVMRNGFKRAWSKAADPEFDYMARNGFLSQEVAEFQKAFNAADGGKNPYMKWITGDPTSPNKFAQKGVVGWASLLTDKSEDFSRSWGHMAGLELAESLGITDKIAKHNFAHDMANKMIANYSPHNRPEIFQGAVGAPIGLFQSFIWAYYQRMFRYVETKDFAALGAQYATQGGIFGLKSVPGFQQMNQLMFEGQDGKTDPYDQVVRRFGQQAGDLIMMGGLGSIPAMFGGEGIDLTARGDTTFRTPVFNSPAVVTTAQKIGDGVMGMVRLFSATNPDVTSQQIGEVLSNTIPNRPIAGFFESMMAGGADTDASGQLISQNANWMETAYRVMGTRSVRQSRELDAFYANKGAMEIQAAKRQELNRATRGIIRSAGDDMDQLEGVMETYIQNGGDPRYYQRWLKSQFEAADSTRGQRMLEQSLKSPQRQDQAQRLLDAHVTPSAENAVQDDYLAHIPDSMDNAQPTNEPTDNAALMYGQPTQ